MSIQQWSRTTADNDQIAKDGMPENMDRSAVNNQSRAQMKAIRDWFENLEWVDLLSEHNGDFTVSANTATSFDVTDANGTDASTKFEVDSDLDDENGMWVKVVGTDSGTNTVVFGYVSAISSYASSKITVTLSGMVDSAYASTAALPNLSITDVYCYANKRIKQGAFHPVGTTTGQSPAELLTIDDLSSAAAITELNTATGLDADTLDGLDSTAFALAATGLARNGVTNSGFDIWQRGTDFSAVTDGSYTADRWYALVETAAFDFDREVTEVPSGARFAMKIETTGTSDKAGLLHILTEADSRDIVDNGTASLSYDVLLKTTGQAISNTRALILEWSGTADDPTVDWIDDWSAAGTDPTAVASWAKANSGSADEHDASDSWTTVTIENVSITAGTKNLAVFIWIEDDNGAYNVGDKAYISKVRLEKGASATAWQPRLWAEELMLCQNHFQTTYDYGVAPGNFPDSNGEIQHPSSKWFNPPIDTLTMDWRFSIPMHSAPTITIYSPNDGSSGFVYSSGDGNVAASADSTGTSGCTIQVTGDVSNLNTVGAHATAESKM